MTEIDIHPVLGTLLEAPGLTGVDFADLRRLARKIAEEHLYRSKADVGDASTTALDSAGEASTVIKRQQPTSRINGTKALPAMQQTAILTAPTDPIELERWLNGIVRLKEGAALRGVHPDTLRREAARGRLKLIRISERAIGIRRRDALMLEDHTA